VLPPLTKVAFLMVSVRELARLIGTCRPALTYFFICRAVAVIIVLALDCSKNAVDLENCFE